MRLLYNILFPLFFLFSAPFYFWKLHRRGNWRQGFGQRFGRHDDTLKQALTGQRVLWLHAVSVGEALLCARLVEVLRNEFKDWALVVSTTTTTGMGELEKQLPPEIHRIYFPIDLAPCVAATFNTIQPDAIILVEAEIWPNFLWRARRNNIPVILANARLSDRSQQGYRRFGFLFRELFAALAAVGAQNENDARRLSEIGCHSDVIEITGSMKFDGSTASKESTVDVPKLLRKLCTKDNPPVLVGGSTHEGEERLLAEMFPRLKKICPGLLLVLVPRHFERARAVGEQLQMLGQAYCLRSELDKPTEADCLVVDSTGELMSFYETATVVFVGKSITARGGQNPIEPAALGRPMVFGPHMQNFRAVAHDFLDASAAVQIQNASELEPAIADLLTNPEKRTALGENAQAVVAANQGATGRTADMAARVLKSLDEPA